MERIAIAITTRNRPEVLKKSLELWDKFLPKNANIIVVDDASSKSVQSDFRFEKQQGIAKAKNKCLELSKGYDHIFLVDDDVMPKVIGWEKPYIESGLNHLALTFDRNYKRQFYSPSIRRKEYWNGYATYSAPNGCFLYLKKVCLVIAGGFRPEFGIWGFEHVEYSQRIHDFGLTPRPFMDVPNSLDLIDVLDWRRAVKSAVTNQEKAISGRENMKVWKLLGGKKEYVPFY